MAQGQILSVKNTPIQRKDYGLATDNKFQGLVTVPFFGQGEQIVENMRLESGFYRKMFGNSIFKNLSGESSVIQNIVLVEEYNKGDGTFQRIVAFRSSTSPDRWKIRGIEDDGTITTPSGGAGDVAFESGFFGYVQIGLVGYISNKVAASTSKNLFSWDGSTLTAVTSAPDNPDFISQDGQRIALGAEGIVSFSQKSTAALSSFTGGAGASVDGNYNTSNPGLQTGAESAAGGIIIFFEKGAELHQVIPTADSSTVFGETRISAATGSAGWNYNGRGIKNNFQVTKDDNFIYIVNTDGLIRIDPLTGNATNLVEDNGAIETIWQNLDAEDFTIEYSPKDFLVCVTAKNTGEAVNDKLICWDVKNDSFYVKTNPTAFRLGNINNQLYAGEMSGSKLYKVFDEDSFEDGDSGTYTAKIIREWDSLGGPKKESRLQRVGAFMNISPNSSSDVNLYLDGFTNIVDAMSITESDIDDTSDVLGVYGDYIFGGGTPDPTTNSDVVKSLYFNNIFGTIAVEITEESQDDFRVYNYDLFYTTTPSSEGVKQFTGKSYSTTKF